MIKYYSVWRSAQVDKGSKIILTKKIIGLLLDIILVAIIFYALFEYCYDSIDNIVTNVHKFYEENSFVYFTTISNIFVMMTSLIALPFGVISFVKKKDLPKWLYILKHISTTYLIITFLIVNLLLVWLVENPMELYEGKELITHVIAPFLAVISFLLIPSQKINFKKEVLAILIPVIIYSIYYLIMVFILKVWSDFYSVGFFYPYSLPLFLILFLLANFFISFLLFKIKEKQSKQ